MLTLREVCAAAEVSAATVRKAVFRTRQGLAQAGDAGYLPRAYMTGRGFRREDVSAWIAARERPAVTQPARAAALRRLGHAG